ncbi:hypothetical protein A0H81_00759 [Grifola frondosa]|uniref:Uncharacterized protein n=1 Tax=Grifola frondosa TaxID=5627 RepID=A0A1C7MSH9_GRIFR|nr:hypothetical protein A0H81_00759 [Grifola frondosa]
MVLPSSFIISTSFAYISALLVCVRNFHFMFSLLPRLRALVVLSGNYAHATISYILWFAIASCCIRLQSIRTLFHMNLSA